MQVYCNLLGAIATSEFVYPTKLIWIVLQCTYKTTTNLDEGPGAKVRQVWAETVSWWS